MQKRSEAEKTDRGQWVYPENEAAYWREQHSKRPVREEFFLRAIRARVSHRLHFIPEVSREELRRSRGIRCKRLREREAGCSFAMGHGASCSKLGLG